MTRSQPFLVKMATWTACSSSVPSNDAPADGGVLALVVLAHDEVVDVAGLAVGERRLEALEQAHGAQVDVLLEAAADRDQQAPQRDVVGHAGPADGAQIDGVVLGDLVEPVGRHHGAGLGEALAGPVEMVPGVVDAEAGADRLQHADALRHHLVADAVAGDDGDPEFVGCLACAARCRHCRSPLMIERCAPWQHASWAGSMATADAASGTREPEATLELSVCLTRRSRGG